MELVGFSTFGLESLPAKKKKILKIHYVSYLTLFFAPLDHYA